MERQSMYIVSLLIFVCTIVLTFVSILTPTWLEWTTTTYHQSYGLHKFCETREGSLTCVGISEPESCHGADANFCAKWRTISFLMSFSVVMELTTLVVYAVILVGGKQRRHGGGWLVLVTLLAVVGVIQAVALSLCRHVFDSEERFIPGFVFGGAFWICVASCALQGLLAVAVVAVEKTLGEEGGYELIPNNDGLGQANGRD